MLRLRDRLEETRDAGPLPAGLSGDDAALLVFTLIQGMAVQAKSGLGRDGLLRHARAALLAWP